MTPLGELPEGSRKMAASAGHGCTVVSAGDDPGGAVARSGAELRTAGHGEMDWFGVLQARVRGIPGDGLAPERINHYFVPRLFGEIATADMIDDVLACGRDLEPDVVLFETYALAGPLVADLLGVPSYASASHRIAARSSPCPAQQRSLTRCRAAGHSL